MGKWHLSLLSVNLVGAMIASSYRVTDDDEGQVRNQLPNRCSCGVGALILARAQCREGRTDIAFERPVLVGEDLLQRRPAAKHRPLQGISVQQRKLHAITGSRNDPRDEPW